MSKNLRELIEISDDISVYVTTKYPELAEPEFEAAAYYLLRSIQMSISAGYMESRGK